MIRDKTGVLKTIYQEFCADTTIELLVLWAEYKSELAYTATCEQQQETKIHHGLQKKSWCTTPFWFTRTWRGTEVRTSAFGRRNFPSPRPIYGWQVTTSWLNYPLWVSQLGQLSLETLQGRQISRNPCRPPIYMNCGDGEESGNHVNGKLELHTAVWLQAKVREHWFELRHRLKDGPIRHWGGVCSLRRCISERYLT